MVMAGVIVCGVLGASVVERRGEPSHFMADGATALHLRGSRRSDGLTFIAKFSGMRLAEGILVGDKSKGEYGFLSRGYRLKFLGGHISVPVNVRLCRLSNLQGKGARPAYLGNLSGTLDCLFGFLFGANKKVPSVAQIERWGRPAIGEFDFGPNLTRLALEMKFSRLDRNVGTKLEFRASSTLPKIDNQGHQRTEGKERLDANRPEHRLGPKRHILLGEYISPLALIAFIPIGIGLLAVGFGHPISKAVDSRRDRWAIVGGFSALVGASLIATAITGLLGG